jgi:hypothetical protein
MMVGMERRDALDNAQACRKVLAHCRLVCDTQFVRVCVCLSV